MTAPVNSPSLDPQEDKRKIFVHIRSLNRNGREWTREAAEMIAVVYLLPPEQIYQWGQQIYEHFPEEHNSHNGTVINRVEAFLSDKWVFRRNALTRKVMMRGIHSKEFVPCKYNDIWRDLQHNLKTFGARIKIPLGDVQTLLESDYVKEYHPIKDYFNRLAPWDGTDHIQALAGHVQCENQQFWATQLRKALVRMIACSYQQIENRIVMTLYTKEQNIGKNRFIKFLVPPSLIEYFKEDPLQPNKDSEIALTQNFLWHLDELEALDRNDMASLKSFISRSSSKQRLAYARQEETRPRIVNFWASTNKEEFLTDWQNTRWLIFRVQTINWDYNNEVTGHSAIAIDQVWAQAWHLYKSKFNYRLDDIDVTDQNKQNKNFETVSMEKQLIMKYLSFGEPDSLGSEFMQPVDVWEFLTKQTGRVTLNQYAIKPAMAQLDFPLEKVKLNDRKVSGYWVRKSLQLNGSQYPMEMEKEPVQPSVGEDLPF